MRKTKTNTKPIPKPKHLPFELMKRPFQTNPNHILLKLMKRSFLKVRAGSRELENETNQTQTQNYTKPTPKPKHLPFELMKRPFQTNPTHILLKLMKRSLLEVKEGSRKLENEKTNPKPKPTPTPTPSSNPNQSPYLSN